MFLGLGKTLFNSSACWISPGENGEIDVELVLTERLTRKKASGAWPEHALRMLAPRWSERPAFIAENRDVMSPKLREEGLNRLLPFYDYLSREALSDFSSHFNSEIRFVTHHRCHAMAALAVSPFEKCVIVVMDGAGSAYEEFGSGPDEERVGEGAQAGHHEESSVYLMDGGKLQCVFKRWRRFQSSDRQDGLSFSEGAGIFYENASEYIFNCKRSSGKVMGLAPFGKAERGPKVTSARVAYMNALDWSRAFRGQTKVEWSESGGVERYADLAAAVQEEFESDYLGLLKWVRESYPDYARVILTGGCALNCTANGKLSRLSWFDEIYVPPFPGDECIGLGAAHMLRMEVQPESWRPMAFEEQHGYFGPRSSEPRSSEIERIFATGSGRDAGFELVRPPSITDHVASILAEGHVVAWFQGRSESGPRALGNRSILADPSRPGLKDHLNRHIKFREDFRPYGSSCLHEKAHEYFEIPRSFDTPYMSFAIRTRAEYRERLAEVTHVDGTSRFQTVRKGQNARFHELIRAFGDKTGLYCLLNTSLNVMGEPIVETPEDAKRFLLNTPVHGLAIGDYYVRRLGPQRQEHGST
jgi:carbamoyltransferase